jgi:hypothetical protein
MTRANSPALKKYAADYVEVSDEKPVKDVDYCDSENANHLLNVVE